MNVDQVALAPVYCAAATALLPFVADLIAPARRTVIAGTAGLGAVATGLAAILVGRTGVRSTFCVPGVGCSYVADHRAALVAAVFAGLTLVVLALSGPALADLPAGEYCFLMGASMTGGVALGYSRDLLSLIIALETLTLPLYLLVGLRRRSVESAQGAVVFFVVSVVATTVTLLGTALLYAVTGTVHLAALPAALAPVRSEPLAGTAAVLIVAGLSFKVAAVPFHAWAPATYDGAPVPVAAYLSTASKLGGVVALLAVTIGGLGPELDVVGPAIAAIAVLTMTVGNLGALRQRRMVRLLAWSSVAQAGYILAPLGALAMVAGRTPDAVRAAVVATLAYTAFYVVLELGAFGSVVALRGGRDGGEIAGYQGVARTRPLVAAAFAFALIGLAGLPPSLAGLFAKVVVVRALVSGGAGWLAIVVALNAVLGLAYYVPVAARLASVHAAPLDADRGAGTATLSAQRTRLAVPVAVALLAVTTLAVVISFGPQWVLDALR